MLTQSEDIQLKLTKRSVEAEFAIDTIDQFITNFYQLQLALSDLTQFQKDIEARPQHERAQFASKELQLRQQTIKIIKQTSNLIRDKRSDAADPGVAVYKAFYKYDKQLLFSNDLTLLLDQETDDFVKNSKTYITEFLDNFEIIQKRLLTRQLLLTKLSTAFTEKHLKSRRALHLSAKFGIGPILFPNAFGLPEDVYRRNLINEKLKSDKLDQQLPLNTLFAIYLIQNNISFPQFGPLGFENLPWSEEMVDKGKKAISRFGKFEKCNGEAFVKQALLQEVQITVKCEACFLSFGGDFHSIQGFQEKSRKLKFLTLEFSEYIGEIGGKVSKIWVGELLFLVIVE
ncbi:hypothetical protein SS50377_25768 [Spironucleus salmonicida]|uniref:Uncharacterized protein n=1 Tax=Spironucleus salmonicida TaxID=348837 RepID=V6LUL3_9EUKA|nr:hypothetical protein SS50377_25768 [Spironucleus salmonicida]|eukprot:EST48255.1 Hypothetical protein SS50377_11596 [Spironucleus salmonicida]